MIFLTVCSKLKTERKSECRSCKLLEHSYSRKFLSVNVTLVTLIWALLGGVYATVLLKSTLTHIT